VFLFVQPRSNASLGATKLFVFIEKLKFFHSFLEMFSKHLSVCSKTRYILVSCCRQTDRHFYSISEKFQISAEIDHEVFESSSHAKLQFTKNQDFWLCFLQTFLKTLVL